MKPTQTLMREHNAVTVALQILGQIVRKMEAGEEVSTDHLDQLLEFIRVFVDQCHHGKEEGWLFPALVEAGIPKEGGPVGVMLAEHEMGRGHVRAMGEALVKYKQGDPTGPMRTEAAAQFIESAKNYIGLLTHHIMKENNILFPMADRALTGDKQAEVLQGFDQVETEKVGAGRHQAFHRLLDALSHVYLEPAPVQ